MNSAQPPIRQRSAPLSPPPAERGKGYRKADPCFHGHRVRKLPGSQNIEAWLGRLWRDGKDCCCCCAAVVTEDRMYLDVCLDCLPLAHTPFR